MQPSVCSRGARVTLTAAVVGIFLALVPVGAEEPARAAPERGADIKGLLERALQDWRDPAERQAILREIHDLFSWQVDQVQGLMGANLEEAREAAERLVEQASHLLDLKQDQPQEYERAARLVRLEGESFTLARKVRAAQGPAREQALGELKRKLGECFDAKQDAMKRELAAMEAEVENLRRRVTKRAESRDRLIERRALDLLGDNDAEW